MKCVKLSAEHITKRRAEAIITHAEDTMHLSLIHI